MNITETSGVALEFTTDSSEVDGMPGQEWAELVNRALAVAYPNVTFCDHDDLNLLTAGSGRPDVSDQINYDGFAECGAVELQELAAKPVDEVVATIASELVEVPDAHGGGVYAFDAADGSGGEWYSANTVLPASVVAVRAYPSTRQTWEAELCFNWENYGGIDPDAAGKITDADIYSVIDSTLDLTYLVETAREGQS